MSGVAGYTKDTDQNREFRQQIEDAQLLLTAYRAGLIKEN